MNIKMYNNQKLLDYISIIYATEHWLVWLNVIFQCDISQQKKVNEVINKCVDNCILCKKFVYVCWVEFLLKYLMMVLL